MITHDELMRYLDGELPPERARAVEEAVERSTELRRELTIFRRMKTDLKEMGAAMEPERTIWVAYGAYAYLTGADALWAKLATSAIVVGLAMLLGSALVDRWRDLKTDPYKEIER